MVFLYKTAKLYATFLKVLGYERGIRRFIDRLELDCPKGSRILDIGCGSGIVGLRLLERLPNSTLLATDLEKNFLKETISNARERRIDERRTTVGLSDISDPEQVTLLNGTSLVLAEHSFDVVAVGGVMGYSRDQVATMRALLGLIKPGGYLINLEMNERPLGKVVATWYNCRPIPSSLLVRTIEGEGHSVSVIPFSVRDFPANLTRVGVVAKISPRKSRNIFGKSPIDMQASNN
jgi:ubiquinone/menaquinone biosynthesis C-methylase UbiE